MATIVSAPPARAPLSGNIALNETCERSEMFRHVLKDVQRSLVSGGLFSFFLQKFEGDSYFSILRSRFGGFISFKFQHNKKRPQNLWKSGNFTPIPLRLGTGIEATPTEEHG